MSRMNNFYSTSFPYGYMENFGYHSYTPKQDETVCPICGSHRIGGDIISYATDECDETLSRFCQDCGYKVVGDFWYIEEHWKDGKVEEDDD